MVLARKSWGLVARDIPCGSNGIPYAIADLRAALRPGVLPRAAGDGGTTVAAQV